MGCMFWLFMPWTCPKSWPRGRCSLREGGGGSISRAVAHIFRSQRRCSPSGHLVTRRVEHIVGIFILAVHALDLSEIVAARSMLFAGGWWRIHFTCGSPYISIPTSGVRLRRLVADSLDPLVGISFPFFPYEFNNQYGKGENRPGAPEIVVSR